jgi:hypothetical protein
VSLVCTSCGRDMICSCQAVETSTDEESLRTALQRALKAEAQIEEVANRAVEREKFEASHATTVVALLREALRWCAGSSDFAVEGKAHEGWKKIGAEAIEIADKYLLRRLRSRNEELAQMRGLPVVVKNGAMDAFTIISNDRDVWKQCAKSFELEAFRARRDAEDYRLKGKAQEKELITTCRLLREANAEIARLVALEKPEPAVKVIQRTHYLKTWPEPFTAILDGNKLFEIRKNDRDYAVGDLLVLQEYDPIEKVHTKRSLLVLVTYLVRGGDWGLPSELCVMGIQLKKEVT